MSDLEFEARQEQVREDMLDVQNVLYPFSCSAVRWLLFFTRSFPFKMIILYVKLSWDSSGSQQNIFRIHLGFKTNPEKSIFELQN